ncbi:MAG: hypothetical protein GWN13_03810 [Phycisphaerae bacterium]|nr:hypothetical protein [Phycisphaerae bacterium]
MFKSLEITVPAGTQADNPVHESLKLCQGTITSISFRPAPGPQWELYAKIEYRETPLVPFDELEWIPLERDVVEVKPNWARWDGTYTIDIYGCSPQARFSHSFIVDIEVEEGPTMVEAILDLISRGL